MTVIAFDDIASSGLFTHLSSIAGLAVDLRYACDNNFLGRNLYAPHDCAWVHREAALGLVQSVAWLKHHHPQLQLVVLDALRPQRVQIALWDKVKSTPQSVYIADPAVGSIHAYGMAVDVTLLDSLGVELDMGTAFDEMSDASHPEFESRMLAAGRITQQHINNRQLLRDALQAGGFIGIALEWWHFDHGERARVRREFVPVA
jgi:zinc D-Ala-D-Ala dipeptidase